MKEKITNQYYKAFLDGYLLQEIHKEELKEEENIGVDGDGTDKQQE